jgi:peptide/nickel transport system permease protein
VLTVRAADYILAAKSVGAHNLQIMLRHVLPNIVGFAVVSFTFGIGGAILTEAGISYLGLGVPLPTPSWGNLIQQANSIAVLQVYWWMWVPPSVALVLCVLSLNAIGDTLRDVFDPHQIA